MPSATDSRRGDETDFNDGVAKEGKVEDGDRYDLDGVLGSYGNTSQDELPQTVWCPSAALCFARW
jgi:hypothetical protein